MENSNSRWTNTIFISPRFPHKPNYQ